jgi:hypothetical protein
MIASIHALASLRSVIARNAAMSPVAQALARARRSPRSDSRRSIALVKHGRSSSGSSLNSLIRARGFSTLTATVVVVLYTLGPARGVPGGEEIDEDVN